MLSLFLTPLTFASSLPLALPGGASLHLASLKDEIAPPGTIALEGGRTQVGIDKKVVQKMVEDNPGWASNLRILDAETPEWTADVNGFYLGVTEVTNEQFAAFVHATGHRPPEEWGKEAIDAARSAYIEEFGKRVAELRAEGKPAPERVPFDSAKWWAENWSTQKWAVPKQGELLPVVSVNYDDVLAYCRWAGVRPMTEEEFQHAVRGTGSSRPYPWGEEWVDAKYCATYEDRAHTEARPVGTFVEGRSPEGIYELLGNVWEWTSSPYLAYPDFKKGSYKVAGEKKEVQPEPTWDGNERVVVGGCYQTTKLTARASVRRSTDRPMMTNGMGFRIAGSLRPGTDVAAAIYAEDVRNTGHRPQGVDFLPAEPATMDLWSHEAGTEGAPEGYAVISGYEYLIFTPVIELEVTDDAEFQRRSLAAPQYLGVLALTFAFQEPALGPGTYYVAYRAAGATTVEVEAAEAAVTGGAAGQEGKPDAPQARAAGRGEDPWAARIDVTQESLLFIDAKTGELAGHVPMQGIVFGKGRTGGKVERFEKMIKVPDPKNEKKTIEIGEPWMRVVYRVPCKIRERGLGLTIDFKPEPGVLEKAWRM